MLLNRRKDFVYDTDHALFTPLHYAVWNIYKTQTQVMRLLVDKGAGNSKTESLSLIRLIDFIL
jgi:hypothetical protein